MGTTTSKRRRIAVPAALAAVAIGGVTVMASGAFFTDTATVTNNTFSAGSVALGVTPTTAAIAATNMSPGDVKYGRIDVSNTGTLELRYSVTQSTTNADGKGLASALDLDIVKVDKGATCNASSFSATQINSTSATFATATVFGSKTAGAQAGDRVLAAGAGEGLCMRVTLPTSAANTLQGATTTGTFTFDAEQTKNNA